MTNTVFPHIRPAGIIFSYCLQLQVLLEITKFHQHKSAPGAGIIRNADIIRGRALYEEIRYLLSSYPKEKTNFPTYLCFLAGLAWQV